MHIKISKTLKVGCLEWSSDTFFKRSFNSFAYDAATASEAKKIFFAFFGVFWKETKNICSLWHFQSWICVSCIWECIILWLKMVYFIEVTKERLKLYYWTNDCTRAAARSFNYALKIQILELLEVDLLQFNNNSLV